MSKNTANTLILAIETSGRIGSVAISLGEKLLAETVFSVPLKHSAEIFPAVCAQLDRLGRKNCEIEQIHISIGPGSFTGLRIAVTIAKIMHLANAAKIVAVDTLDVIAANAADFFKKQENSPVQKIATILDAKRGQFFIAVYQHHCGKSSGAEDEGLEKILPDSLMTASQFLDQFATDGQPIALLGEGLVYYKDKFKAKGIEFLPEQLWRPSAAKVHLLGWQMALREHFADPLTLKPTYLRGPVA